MYDVYGVGNAIVDVIVEIEDQFLTKANLDKGHMTLVDQTQMNTLGNSLKSYPRLKMSGGSAANTIFAIQAFGGTTAYACRFSEDDNGRFFYEESDRAGISIHPKCISKSGDTGQCLVLITPDAERTMTTNLGISSDLESINLDQEAILNSRYLYLEGYLATSAQSTETALIAREIARSAGKKVAVTLSDASLIEHFREPLESLVGNEVDLLFCNQEECLAWAKTDSLDFAIREIREITKEAYITLGSEGSIAISKTGETKIPTDKVVPLDTNGAGDIYAGACIFARSNGLAEDAAAAFGNKCAGSIVQQPGARFTSIEAYQRLM